MLRNLCLVLVAAVPVVTAEDVEQSSECAMNLQVRQKSDLVDLAKVKEPGLEDSSSKRGTAALVQRGELVAGSVFSDLSFALELKKGLNDASQELFNEVTNDTAIRPEVPGMCNVSQHNIEWECSYDQYGPNAATRRRSLASARRRAAPRPVDAGSVARLYTTGAPTPSKCPLVNELREGCCFDGLRVYARDDNGRYDPVNVAAKYAGGLRHVFMKSMELRTPNEWTGDYEEVVHQCGHAKDRDEVTLTDICVDAFKCHVHSYWDWFFGTGAKGSQTEARRILSLTPYAIWGPDHPQREGHFQDDMIAPKDLGFRLVGMFSEKLDTLGIDADGVMLYQGGDNECYLTFSQTLSLSDWITNIQVMRTGWCGAEGIHYGWVKELRQILDHPKYACEIKSKLPSCASVTVAGYSLGGALAQIFSFCANRQSPGLGCLDFQRVTWTKGNVTELPNHNPSLCA